MSERLIGRNSIDFDVTEDTIATNSSLDRVEMSVDDAERIVQLASELSEGKTVELDTVTFTRGSPTGDTDDEPKITFGDEVQSAPNPTVKVVDLADAVDMAEELAEDEGASYSGWMLRAESSSGSYGCEIPLDADVELDTTGNDIEVHFNESDDMSELDSWDSDRAGFDSGAYVTTVERVER